MNKIKIKYKSYKKFLRNNNFKKNLQNSSEIIFIKCNKIFYSDFIKLQNLCNNSDVKIKKYNFLIMKNFLKKYKNYNKISNLLSPLNNFYFIIYKENSKKFSSKFFKKLNTLTTNMDLNCYINQNSINFFSKKFSLNNKSNYQPFIKNLFLKQNMYKNKNKILFIQQKTLFVKNLFLYLKK